MGAGLFAAGLMQGMARGFDDYITQRDRDRRINEAYLQRLMSDVDVVEAVSTANRQKMNDEVEGLIKEASEKLRAKNKLFGKPAIDSAFLLDFNKQVSDTNRRFATIKQEEQIFARDDGIYRANPDKWDPDAYQEALKSFMETGIYSSPLLTPRAASMDEIMKTALSAPPRGYMATPYSDYQGNNLVKGVRYQDNNRNPVPKELAVQQLGVMASQNPNIARGLIQEFINNAPIEDIQNYMPVFNAQDAAKASEQLELVKAKRATGGNKNLIELEKDPKWQTAAYRYATEKIAPTMYGGYITGIEEQKPEKYEDSEAYKLAKKKEEEGEKASIYDVTDNQYLPDGSTATKAVVFRPGKAPVITLNTDDIDPKEVLDKNMYPKNETFKYKVTHIADGFAYIEGDNPTMMETQASKDDKRVQKGKKEKSYVIDPKKISKYSAKIPLSKIENQIRPNPKIKWGDTQSGNAAQPKKYTDSEDKAINEYMKANGVTREEAEAGYEAWKAKQKN